MLYRLLLLFVILAATNRAAAADLEVTIHPHAERVVFGDPLYLEVTIVNNGDAPVTGPMPHPDLNTLALRLLISNIGSDEWIVLPSFGPAPQAKTMVFEPGQPRTFYWYVFLPKLSDLADPFWQPLYEGGRVVITANYHDGDKKLGWTTKGTWVRIAPRDAAEARTLERLNAANRHSEREAGPSASDFGILPRQPLSRRQTAELAEQIQTGELADLLRIVIRLQKLYDTPAAERDADNRKLIEWLSIQPEVMGKALASKIQSVAMAHGMSSTATAVESLLKSKEP
jgi:hypothetical protein